MLPEPLTAVLDPQYAALARELAQGIRPTSDILNDYGFSSSADPLWIALTENASFQQLLDAAVREWNAADTTARRVRLKAMTSMELSLPALHEIIHDSKADRADRINAAKVMKSLAGFDEPAGGSAGSGGGGVVVKINIGTQQVVKATTPITTIEHEESSL